MKRFKIFKNFAKKSEVHSSFSPDDCTPSIVVLIFLFRLSIFIGLVPESWCSQFGKDRYDGYGPLQLTMHGSLLLDEEIMVAGLEIFLFCT